MERVSVPCPEVSGDIDDFGTRHPQKYSGCNAIELVRWWEGPDQLPQEKAVAYVGGSAAGLCFYVWLEDHIIYTEAREDNERIWTLGDTAEFFIKPGIDRDDYWEIHISPNGFIMDIHIPSRAKFTEGIIIWEEVIAADSASTKRVQVGDGEKQWAVELCVPWAAFGLEGAPAAGTVWQFAVCRYNYPGKLEDPEHSSTAHFTEPGYHRYEEYTDLVFA
jgi:hypothetical protein